MGLVIGFLMFAMWIINIVKLVNVSESKLTKFIRVVWYILPTYRCDNVHVVIYSPRDNSLGLFFYLNVSEFNQ